MKLLSPIAFDRIIHMKNVYLFLVLLFSMGLICSSSVAAAEDPDEEPIEQQLQKCIDKDSTTAGMTNCQEQAYENWDRELNKVYAELMKKLPSDAKETLKDAQTAWLKFRDSEFVLIDKIYAQLQGTMYIPMRVADRTQIVEDRVIALRGFLFDLEN
jgi:uncharacterized protein YecT (DUF1311 family)